MLPPLLAVILLGVVQGLTEFLPVSSDGHLALLLSAMPSFPDALPLEVILHGGTLLAILIYFRREIAGLFGELPGLAKGEGWNKGYVVFVLIGTIPTGIIGLGLKDTVEAATASRPWIFAGMAVTACLLVLADAAARRRTEAVALTWRIALAMGVAQGLAVMPGLSRSGATIAMALLLGLPRETAFTFSFLLAIPATAGAMVVTGIPDTLPAGWPAGVIAALAVGLAVLRPLRSAVVAARLSIFAIYLVALIGAALALGFFR